MSGDVSDSVLLALANVESAYGPIKAIRGVSLQVKRGQIATVLGSNGAGKSTILKTISGIIDPRRGTIEFKGESIAAKDPALIVRMGLSHVPEGREVFPLLSVRDNLLMGAYTRSDGDGVARDIISREDRPLGRVAIIAHRDHAWRCVEVSRAAGLDAGIAECLDLPGAYDPQSGQDWTRSREAYLLHDLMARLMGRRAEALARVQTTVT